MVRPSPSRGLPEAKYVELFNRSRKTVNIENWIISVGSSSRVIEGEWIMEPGGFLILADEKNKDLLETYGTVAGIPGFPQLPASGQSIVLRDEAGDVISAIRYTDKWYGDDLKSAGGWSIEQIDPNNPCGGQANWIASAAPEGGTPGMDNSARDLNPDRINPEALRATIIASNGIRLHFNEPLHPMSGWEVSNFSVTGAGNPVHVVPVKPYYEAVDLYFGCTFDKNTDYHIETEGNLFDCAGNSLKQGSRIRFAVPGEASENDLIINEILFNPMPGGAPFIEIVNISGKTLDLGNLEISGTDLQQSYTVFPGGYLLFPGDYAVLTTDPEAVMGHYFSPGPGSFIHMDRMPRLNNESGRISITDGFGNIIEQVLYSSGMHSPFIANRKGVSLERTGYLNSASDPVSWMSASELSGFATPGYRNSQSTANEDNLHWISVEPGMFSPGHSAYNDKVAINYQLDKPGYTGSIIIFDHDGRIVRKVAVNELLGTSGFYYWDGRNEADRLSRPGIYIVLMDVLHPRGDKHRFRASVVLAGRLR